MTHFLEQQKWEKLFKKRPSKIFIKLSNKLKGYGLLNAYHNTSNFLKAIFHGF